MSNITNELLTMTEALEISEALDEKLLVGPNAVLLIMNFLGDGLCSWCEHEPTQGQQRWCDQCTYDLDHLWSPEETW